MLIAVDLDGVVRDFLGQLAFRIGTRPERYHLGTWDIFTGNAASQTMKAECMTPGFVEACEVIQSGAEMVKRLSKKHEVVFLTAPWPTSPSWLQETSDWVACRFGLPAVHCPASMKPFFSSDVLVEDNPETAYAWAKRNPNGNAYLLRKPWNHKDISAMDPDRNNFFIVNRTEEILP